MKGFTIVIIIAALLILVSSSLYFLFKFKYGFVSTVEKNCNYNKDWDGCYTDSTAAIAIQNKDISLCENGPLLFSSDFNSRLCYSKYIATYPNIEQCNKVKINRYWCIAALAEHQNNADLCLEVLKDRFSEEPELEKDWCLDQFGTRDMAICDKMGNNNYRTGCVTRIAIAKADIDICKRYVREEDQQETAEAIEMCKYDVARKTRNRSLCDAITIDFTRELCHRGFMVK